MNFKPTSREDYERLLLSPFIERTNSKKVNLDFNKLTHKKALDTLYDYLISLSEVTRSSCRIITTHGLSEDGIDLYTKFPEVNLTVGWQLKSFNDHEEADFQTKTIAQISRSKKYRCDYIAVIHCTDLKRHEGRIRAFQTEIIQIEPDYVRIIMPDQFSRIMDRDNWASLRAKGLSSLLGASGEDADISARVKMPDEPLNVTISNEQTGLKIIDAIKQYELGMQNVRKGDYPLALEHFAKTLQLEPAASVLNAIGATYLMENRNESALDYFRRSLALDDKLQSARTNMITALKRLGYLDEAVKIAKAHYEDQPIDGFIILCKTLISAGKNSEVYELIKNIDVDTVQDYPSCIIYANAAINNNDVELAERYYEKCISMAGSDFRGYWGLGICQRGNGRLSEAIVSFTHAVELKPDDPGMHIELGNCLRDDGRPDEAMVELLKAKILAPWSVPAAGNLANLIRDNGRYLEALEAYDYLMRIAPTDPLVWENRGRCLMLLGLWNEAYQSYMTSIKLSPQPISGVYNNAGICAYELGMLAKAEGLYQEGIKQNEKDWGPHSSLGLLYQKLKQWHKAALEYEKGIIYGKKTPGNYTSLASCYIQINELKKAEENIDKALELDPQFAPAIGTKGIIKKNTGKRKEAVKLFKAALSIDPSLFFVQEEMKSL